MEKPFINARHMEQMMALGQAASRLSQLKVLVCVTHFSVRFNEFPTDSALPVTSMAMENQEIKTQYALENFPHFGCRKLSDENSTNFAYMSLKLSSVGT